jgi:23S rRNA pseudouridine955/2504/2580 synthase
MMEKLCRTGQIRVDSSRVKPNFKLIENQIIRIPNFIRIKKQKNDKIFTKQKAELFYKIKKNIIYEDEYFIIFNKPFGLAVQGGSKLGTVHLDGILPFFSERDYPIPKLIHRLDKDTSGILVVAKTPKSASAFSKLMIERRIKKSYWALVNQPVKHKTGILYTPQKDEFVQKKNIIYKYNLNKDYPNAKFFFLEAEDKEMVSTYKELKVNNENVSLLNLLAVTGRKHQLRKQLAAIGYPIIGDKKYTKKSQLVTDNGKEKLQLHARGIIFRNPMSGKLINVKCPPPVHMKKFLNVDEIDQF